MIYWIFQNLRIFSLSNLFLLTVSFSISAQNSATFNFCGKTRGAHCNNCQGSQVRVGQCVAPLPASSPWKESFVFQGCRNGHPITTHYDGSDTCLGNGIPYTLPNGYCFWDYEWSWNLSCDNSELNENEQNIGSNKTDSECDDSYRNDNTKNTKYFGSGLEKINRFQQTEWFPFAGNLDVVSEGMLKFTPDIRYKDIYAIVSESSINADFIRPVSLNYDLNSQNNQFEFHIKKGSNIELHYKHLTHIFKLDMETERHFYVDMQDEKIVFVDDIKSQSSSSCGASCYAWTVLFYSKCCSKGKHLWRVGLGTCSDHFCASECC